MKPENTKWICGDNRKRFQAPSEELAQALVTLTGAQKATIDHIKALRILGAPIAAEIKMGKSTTEI